MAKADLSAERLRELFQYVPETGLLTWAIGPQRGRTAGNADPRGYVALSIGGRKNRTRVYVHQVAWALVTGHWPLHDVDHINHDKSDNRFCNLRALSRSLNQQNQIRAHANNKTGFLGVCLVNGRYRATIRAEGVNITVGHFDTPEEAHTAYVEAKRRLHPAGTL